MDSLYGDSSWWELPLQSDGLPSLLISANFTSSSYTIRLTDLANLWEEGLDRKAICMRGFTEDTSIDPSEGPENMKSFLSWVEAALAPWHSDHSHTTATLSSAGGGDLFLDLTCRLPAGLRTLKWPIHLKKMAFDRVATDLVLPLIEVQQKSQKEVASLIEIIVQKDAAMTRLLDKLEVTGTGLDQVFPVLTGKRKVSRASAGERVSGLSPFNHKTWRERIDSVDDTTSDSHALLLSAFGGKGLSCKSRLELPASLDSNDWWTKMSGVGTVTIGRPEVEIDTKVTPPPSKAPEDDDFQIQATPPRLQVSRKRATLPNTTAQDDENTADETDAGTPERNLLPPSKQVGDTKVSKLGAIGRKKRQTPTPSPPPVSVTKGSESETASEADDDPTAPLQDSSPAPVRKSPPAPQHGGLGRIGGSKPQDPPPKHPPASPQPQARRVEDLAAGPSLGKLGAIGKKTISESGADVEAPSGRGRTAASDTSGKEEARRETSQERADRKRAELHRELEKRATSGPAKKKRRF